jgi:hypothetical protein
MEVAQSMQIRDRAALLELLEASAVQGPNDLSRLSRHKFTISWKSKAVGCVQLEM